MAIRALALLALTGCTATMRMSSAELQADLDRRFPLETEVHHTTLRASEPRIELPGTPDTVAIRTRIDVASARSAVHGTSRVEGRIDYVAAEHAFYLRDPHVTELALAPPAGDGKLAHAMRHDHGLVEQAARLGIEKLLRERPIYQLDARRSAKEAKAIEHLRSVHTDRGDLVLEVGL